MLAVNYSTIRENLKSYCDKVTDNNETVIVTRKDEKNVVIISLDEWNSLQRALRNAEYLGKLNRCIFLPYGKESPGDGSPRMLHRAPH